MRRNKVVCCSADKTLDASRSAWFGQSLWPGKPSNSSQEVAFKFICPLVVIDPTDSGATIVVALGQTPGHFLPSSNANRLLFLVNLVRGVLLNNVEKYLKIASIMK